MEDSRCQSTLRTCVTVGDSDLRFSTEESHWCCTMRGAEGLYRLTEYQVFPDTDGTLRLPFGLPGDYTHSELGTGNSKLKIESTYPHAATWIFTNLSTTPLTVRLFIPPWIQDLTPAHAQNSELATGNPYLRSWLTLPLDLSKPICRTPH